MKKNNVFHNLKSVTIYISNVRMLCLFSVILISQQINAQQNTITVFDEILFYDGYAPLVDEADLYEPVPTDVLRHTNSRYAKKLTSNEIGDIGNTLEVEVNLKAACDNYDRLAHVFLAFVDKGETTYNINDVDRIEVARFITPFMNKNISPNNLFYNFKTDNIAEILTNQDLLDDYDIWVELEVFGVPYAAQTQVSGCAGRIDTFYATLNLISDVDPNISYTDDMVFIPLTAQLDMNNYNATDVSGETTRIIDFELTDEVENAKLYLITSNHGANTGGEEYNRRWHYVYMDNNLIHEYIPGGRSCEPFRQYNTQGNGIYSAQPRSTRMWLSFNNWCPGDVIPVREIELGTLAAGVHTFKIDVPAAVFNGQEGNIPLSVYLHNRNSGNEICIVPQGLTAEEQSSSEIFVDWIESGDAEEWEILYGPVSNINVENKVDANNNGNTGGTVEGLNPSVWYQIYARSVCDENFNSTWVGPILAKTEQLSVGSNDLQFFQYYPNPVEDNLMLKSNNMPIDQVRIFNLSGQELLLQKPNEITTTLHLSELSAGVYFMQVQISGDEKTFKLVKK